jgi:cephalosporin hydroxylase
MNEIFTPNWPIAQKKYELLALQEFLKEEKIARVLEVGTWTGGTALLWAKMVSRYDDGVVYCLDLGFSYGVHYANEPGTEIMREYSDQVYRHTRYNKYIKELAGDTHDPAFIEQVKNVVGGPVDFIFIDGDHSYEGVKADFLNYAPLIKVGGAIAFHDIIDSEHHRHYGCFVAQFWEELKSGPGVKFWEFIDNNEYLGNSRNVMPSRSMGIGVVRRTL